MNKLGVCRMSVLDNSQNNFMNGIENLRDMLDDFDLDAWRYLFVIHKFGIEEITTKLNILNEEYDYLHAYNPIEHLETRIKTPEKTVEKLIRQGFEVSPESAKKNLHDIGGIRIVCSFVEDIYVIYENLCRQTDLKIVGVKDYIKNPKPNGYRSLHLLVEVPVFLTDRVEQVVIEVQIRTIAMDFWASLEHKIYYKKKCTPQPEIVADLTECADLAALLDKKMQRIKYQIEPHLTKEILLNNSKEN